MRKLKFFTLRDAKYLCELLGKQKLKSFDELERLIRKHFRVHVHAILNALRNFYEERKVDIPEHIKKA